MLPLKRTRTVYIYTDSNDTTIELSVLAKKGDGLITFYAVGGESVEIRLLHNGKLVGPSVLGLDQFKDLFEQEVTLPVTPYVSYDNLEKIIEALQIKYRFVGKIEYDV